MKKTFFYLIIGIFFVFTISAFTNLRNPIINVVHNNKIPQTLQTATNTTNGVTTTFQYFINNGIYTAPQSTFQGQTVTLTNYSHSPGQINIDKWHGQLGDYFIDVTITGTQNMFWNFYSVNVYYSPE